MDDIDKKIRDVLGKVKKPGWDIKSDMCPGDEDLSRYIDGVIKGKEKERIEHHFLECNDCLDTLLLHKKMREDEVCELSPDAPDSWRERAKNLYPGPEKESSKRMYDIILGFAQETLEVIKNPGNLTISHTTVTAPVRADRGVLSPNIITLGKTFADMTSEVEVEKVGDRYVNMKVMIKDIQSEKPVEGLRISLFNPSGEIASYVAKTGEAYFEGLRCGEYVIKITKVSERIGQISLNIKE